MWWSFFGCVLVGCRWDQYRLLEEWSYGWAYSRYFDHTIGRVGGRIVGRIIGRSDVVVVWVVTDCRLCDGRVRKLVV